MSGATRTVVATGGSGALGRAVVRRFLEAGDRVVVPWIVEAEREELAGEQAEALRAQRLVLLEADVAEEAGARAAVEAAGDLTVLINGVGGFEGGAPVHETELAVWDRMLRLNLRCAVAMSRAALPSLLRRGSGAILNVASQAAFDRPAGLAAYSASKAALVAFTETLQREVGADGVRVNAVVPTTIDTPANRAAMPDADFSAWTPPARIASVLLWLASDEARSVRGGFVPV